MLTAAGIGGTVLMTASARALCAVTWSVCLAAAAIGIPDASSAQSSQRADRMRPGMAITGRVLDPNGQPVPNVYVTALHRAPVPGRTFSFVSARLHGMTNDRGEYRLDGLYAGEFFLIALPHNASHDERGTPKRTGFGNTFFPGVATFGEAKPVRVAPGVTPTADITLLPAPVRTISGTVFGSNGQPVPGGVLGMTHGDGFFGLDTRVVRIAQNGTFRAPALQPGTYFLQFRESQWPPAPGVTPKISQAKVTISEADVAGVRVAPLQMVRGRGRLVIEAADRESLDVASVRVNAFPDPVDGNPGPQRGGTVQPDMTFEFATWPLPARIRVVIESPGWTVKAIRHKGVDVTNRPIEFVQGQDVTGLEVLIARSPDRS